jgi:hypothetical protein
MRLAAAVRRSAVQPTGSLANLPTCIADARAAALEEDDGPPEPTTFRALRTRLDAARAKLPPAYQRAAADPLLRALDLMGAEGYRELLSDDPRREGAAALLMDMVQAILQNGEGYQELATDAFQEVVSDLYDGFLSAEDRRGVKPPDHGVLPPLVRWGSAASGPYTWPVTATAAFEVKAPIVSLPAANARRGLLAWSALAHETVGHDLLEADDGLHEELARAVREKLARARIGGGLADYWADRLGETASDVLGVLNMGPAAAVGVIGYFRALNGAYRGAAALRNVGAEEDSHPADIVRGWLCAETVRLLSFSGAREWADLLVAEVDRDLGRVRLAGVAVPPEAARESAALVARTIVKEQMAALERHALGDIQDWRDRDEEVVRAVRRGALGAENSPAPSYAAGTYAAHVVAAAVTAALEPSADVPGVMRRMLGTLKAMHDANPSWGPRYCAAIRERPAHGAATALRAR